MTTTDWPRQPEATWPPCHLIENAASHPNYPWLAVGSLRSTTRLQSFAGWSDDAGLLRWHPDGLRLATNTDTNGVTLLDRAQYVGTAFPDETRDSGVRYLWIGDELFSDTGELFQIQPGDDSFEFGAIEIEMPNLNVMEWNASGRFVVGRARVGRRTTRSTARSFRSLWYPGEQMFRAVLSWGESPQQSRLAPLYVALAARDSRLSRVNVVATPRVAPLTLG